MNALNQSGTDTTEMPKVSQNAWSSGGVRKEAVRLPTVAVKQKELPAVYDVSIS